MAVVLEAPAVFVIENNYYSEHTNISYAVGCDDLRARKPSASLCLSPTARTSSPSTRPPARP